MAFTQVASLIYIEGSFELLTHPHLTLPAGSTLLAGDSMNGRQIQWTGRKKAALYQQYSYGILLVQLCSTAGATMLHLWCQNVLLFWHCQNFWYSYAGLLVFLCWTVGIAMLNLWYTYAVPLVPECYTLLVPFFYLIYSQYFRFDLSQFTSL